MQRRMNITRRAIITALTCVLGAIFAAGAARAEVFELIDKTKMVGELVHYYDGVFSVKVAGGNTVKLPREKVKSVTLELPKPRAELSTVEKTFDRWKKALAKGDLDTMIDCYALVYQGMLAMQVGQPGEATKKIQEEFGGAVFEIKGAQVKGDTATLKVAFKKGDTSDTGEIAFVRENGEWKMLPPQ